MKLRVHQAAEAPKAGAKAEKEEKDLEQEKEDNPVREEAPARQPHLPVYRRPPHLLLVLLHTWHRRTAG
jgi:hypothetical protein